MAMAVAAVCCSIGAPVKAEAACEHVYYHDDTITNSYTQQHGYSVGDDKYKNCTITTTTKEYIFKCYYCPSTFTETETTVTHSDCGL